MRGNRFSNIIEYGDDDKIDIGNEEKIVVNAPEENEDDDSNANHFEPKEKTQGSVFVRTFKNAGAISTDHVMAGKLNNALEQMVADKIIEQGELVPDSLYIAHKIKTLFRREYQESGVTGFFWKFLAFITNLFRDISIPMAEMEAWNRNRAAIVVVMMPSFYFFLSGDLVGDDVDDLTYWIILVMLVPCIFLALLVRFCTYQTVAPKWLNFVFAILAFLMSILWIGLASDIVVDCITMAGIVMNISELVLLFTVLSIGNCLGDLNANLAMTRKGFGEMAITGCVAGPIFTTYIGIGVSLIASISTKDDLVFYTPLYVDDVFQRKYLIPIILIAAQIINCIVMFANGFMTNFNLSVKFTRISLIIYAVTIVGLIIETFIYIDNQE